MALIKCKECGESISKKADKCPKCGAPQKKKTSLFAWLVLILVVLFVVGLFSGKSGTTKRTASPKEVAMENVELNFSWAKTGFGSVMEADFTIINNSNYRIKDIEIKCTHYAGSGTQVDSNKRTIYNTVAAKSKITIRKFNMGFIHSQAEKTKCTITDLKV